MMNNIQSTRVSILALNESSMMTLASVIDPLRAANRLSRQPVFEWQLISVAGAPIRLTSGLNIEADAALKSVTDGDILIVIAGFNHQQHLPRKFYPQLHKAVSKHNLIFAIEAGTWILAEANILQRQRVTTHWEDLESLAFAFPNLQVLADRFVIDKRFWSCGGASPALDMLLHYLRTNGYRSLAMDVAHVFIYQEPIGSADLQDKASLIRLQQVESRLAEIIELMINNIEEPLLISQIADQLGLSKRLIELLFQKHLKISPAAYYLRLRLQQAKRLLNNHQLNMMDIAVRTGFNSQSAFSRAFKQRYSANPSSYRDQII